MRQRDAGWLWEQESEPGFHWFAPVPQQFCCPFPWRRTAARAGAPACCAEEAAPCRRKRLPQPRLRWDFATRPGDADWLSERGSEPDFHWFAPRPPVVGRTSRPAVLPVCGRGDLRQGFSCKVCSASGTVPCRGAEFFLRCRFRSQLAQRAMQTPLSLQPLPVQLPSYVFSSLGKFSPGDRCAKPRDWLLPSFSGFA